MLADYHLHTHNSEDSHVTMEEYAKKALELGLKISVLQIMLNMQ